MNAQASYLRRSAKPKERAKEIVNNLGGGEVRILGPPRPLARFGHRAAGERSASADRPKALTPGWRRLFLKLPRPGLSPGGAGMLCPENGDLRMGLAEWFSDFCGNLVV